MVQTLSLQASAPQGALWGSALLSNSAPCRQRYNASDHAIHLQFHSKTSMASERTCATVSVARSGKVWRPRQSGHMRHCAIACRAQRAHNLMRRHVPDKHAAVLRACTYLSGR